MTARTSPRFHVYRNYSFLNKDPVIDKMRTLIRDEGLKWHDAAKIADMSPATLDNWFKGSTRRPQFSSIASLTHSLGYSMEFRREGNKKIDVEAELKAAADFRLKQAKKKDPPARLAREFAFD